MADGDFLPDSATLTAIRDLSAACLWAKVEGDPENPRTLLGAFLKAAGGKPTLVQLARLPRAAIEALASNLRVELAPVEGDALGEGDGAGDAPTPAVPTRPVSLLETSSRVALHDVCLAATGRWGRLGELGARPTTSRCVVMGVCCDV